MKLILAADEKWAIGKDGNLLCHIPGDLKFFQRTTLNKTVVMGRATLESLPGKKPLKERNNIVITRNMDYKVEGATVVHSTEELLKLLSTEDDDNIFIIGGEMVYKEFLPRCDTCFITKIKKTFDADKHFVNLDQDENFDIVWRSEIHEENGIKYEFLEYRRKK